MTQYIGVDIVEIDRIRQAIAHRGERFLKRVYTQREIELYGGKSHSLAARFAGKEAVYKALQKPGGTSWQDIEIVADARGKPVVGLYGKAREQAGLLGLDGVAVSLAHSREQAIAFASGIPR